MSAPSIAERVAAGAAWLDEHQPGWIDVIDLERLDLQAACFCILGQLHGNFWTSPSFTGDRTRRIEAAAPYGFAIDDEGGGLEVEEAQYEALTAAWRELIEQRRAER